MNIYDFDKTIYDGDSSIDFFKHCIKINKKVLKIIPKFCFAFFLYILKIKEKEYLKSVFFSFVKYIDNLDDEVKNFWDRNENKIKNFYIQQKKDDDIIISASPEFLLEPISKKFNFKLIATQVDTKTGELISKNCHGDEKVERLAKLGIISCDNFFSDSLSDTPCSNIARIAYVVCGNDLVLWNEYKKPLIKKIISTFASRDFFTFVFIGLINVINGVWMALVYSVMINNSVLAYIFGFLSSLIISYILNSKLNFKERLSLGKSMRFFINNIPNFLIQFFSVVVLLDILKLPKIYSYLVSAVIAVPITFILVKLFVFKNDKEC